MVTNMKEAYKDKWEVVIDEKFEAKAPKEKYRLTLAKLTEVMDDYKKKYPIDQNNDSNIV